MHLAFYISDGISVPEIKKWPGSLFGFTFHCWISLDKMNNDSSYVKSQGTSSYRRQIFTYMIFQFLYTSDYVIAKDRVILFMFMILFSGF